MEWFSKYLFPASYRLHMYKLAAAMFRNKLTIVQVLETLRDMEEDRGTALLGPWRVAALNQWIREVKDGQNIGLVMGPAISGAEKLLIASGVQSSKLEDAFKACHRVVKGRLRSNNTIKKQSAFPALLFASLFIMIYVIVWIVLPTFDDTVPMDGWVGAPAIFADIAFFVEQKALVMLAVFLGLGALIAYSLPNWAEGRLRVFFDRIPPWSIYKAQMGSTFLMTAASMEATGIRLDGTTLNEMASFSPSWQATRLRALGRLVDDGHNLGSAMLLAGHEYPDKSLPHLIKVFYDLDHPEEALLDLAEEQIEWSVEYIEASMSILNKIALILVGLILAGTGFSIFSLMALIGGTSL